MHNKMYNQLKNLIARGELNTAWKLLGQNPPQSKFLPDSIRKFYTDFFLDEIDKKKKNVTRPSHILECKKLDDFALFYRTDKSSELHDLCNTYEKFLSQYRDKSFNLYEFGVLEFSSINMWGSYFPHAQIFGVDPGQSDKIANIIVDNAAYICEDAYNSKILNNIFSKFPPFIIIDDATHYYSHQIEGFEIYFQFIQPGGIYIVEDLETSHYPLNLGIWNDQPLDTVSYFTQLAVLVNGGFNFSSHKMIKQLNNKHENLYNSVEFITFCKNAVIIKKK